MLGAGVFWMESFNKLWEWLLSVGDWISSRKQLLAVIMLTGPLLIA